MIAIAALTSVNGSMIVGARSNYALGRDWPLLRFLGHWDETSGSPRQAMLIQGIIALALVAFGVPGYPVVPAIFVLVCGYLLYSSLAYHGKHALVGLGVLAVGAVVVALAGRSAARA